MLKEAVPTGLLVSLDLHCLAATLSRAPRTRDEGGRLLRRAIQTKLDEQLASDSQQVFVVTGCDLFSRYQVSLNPFFQLASEKRMIILVVPVAETNFQPSSPLPGYVVLDAAASFDYLHAAVGSTATISID